MSSATWHFLLVYNVMTITAVPAEFPMKISPAGNKVSLIGTRCDSNTLNVTLIMESSFKGVVYARDFPRDCFTLGKSTEELTLILPTSGCGVSLTTHPDPGGKTKMMYSVDVVIQQDKFLRQITDLLQNIQCTLSEEAFLVKSPALARSFQDENINKRVGRMKDAGWSKELEGKQFEEELKQALDAAKVWMEIEPEKDQNDGRLQVGKTAHLKIKTTLPDGVGWRVVNCTTYDGLREDLSQPLLDKFGCTLDDTLLPNLIYTPVRVIGLMKHQEALSSFLAFQFPDRNRVHFTCSLQLCKGVCSKVNCNNRIGKSATIDESQVLDKIEIFNSVEVLPPPMIEDIRIKSNGKDLDIKDPEFFPYVGLLSGRKICMSPTNMGIMFTVLGVVFWMAIMIVLFCLVRIRKRTNTKNGTAFMLSSYSSNSRSLFSSSYSSAGDDSAFGSRLLLRDSPPVVSRTRHYWRMI